MTTFVKQACYEPLRKTTEATHFKRLTNGQWTACSSGEPGAEAKTMRDFTDPQALVPPSLEYVCLDDKARLLESTTESQAYCGTRGFKETSAIHC